MKTIIGLSLLVAVATAGVLPPVEDLEGRITNGELAKPGQFPYQVGLSLAFGEKSAWCGGTLISDRWVLTAAHCTDNADSVTVYLGAIDIKNGNEKGQQRIFVSKKNIIVHEDWDAAVLRNDISLIKLPVAVEFNDRVQPAALPKMDGKYSTYEGDFVWASGWGKDSDSATAVTQFLQFIEAPVIKNSVCNRYYLGSVTENMICISTSGKKSTCNGDSGGPLVYKDGETNYVIGATSFGIALGCEKAGLVYFTRVTAYLDWIEANLVSLTNKVVM